MRAYVPRTSCIFYFSLSLSFIHPFSSAIIHLEAKFPVSFYTRWGIATFFILSRSRNVHFSPGALMQRCRGRHRFIAFLAFSAIRFSPATGWPWSKWNLLSSTMRDECCMLRRASPSSLFFFFLMLWITTSQRLMNNRGIPDTK